MLCYTSFVNMKRRVKTHTRTIRKGDLSFKYNLNSAIFFKKLLIVFLLILGLFPHLSLFSAVFFFLLHLFRPRFYLRLLCPCLLLQEARE